MTTSILRRIEPAVLGKDGGFDDVTATIGFVKTLPRFTFGPVILHPSDCFYAFAQGVEYGVVINYPSGGGILQWEMRALWDIHSPKCVDICMPHPGRVFSRDAHSFVTKTINEVKKILAGMEWSLKNVRIMYDFPLIDDKLIDAICDEASAQGFEWIKSSTGVYSKTSIEETKRLSSISKCYDLLLKSAGGINTLPDATAHIRAGAAAVGTSSWRKMYDSAKSKGS